MLGGVLCATPGGLSRAPLAICGRFASRTRTCCTSCSACCLRLSNAGVLLLLLPVLRLPPVSEGQGARRCRDLLSPDNAGAAVPADWRDACASTPAVACTHTQEHPTLRRTGLRPQTKQRQQEQRRQRGTHDCADPSQLLASMLGAHFKIQSLHFLQGRLQSRACGAAGLSRRLLIPLQDKSNCSRLRMKVLPLLSWQIFAAEQTASFASAHSQGARLTEVQHVFPASNSHTCDMACAHACGATERRASYCRPCHGAHRSPNIGVSSNGCAFGTSHALCPTGSITGAC